MMGDLAPGASMLDLDKSPGDVGITTNEKGDVIYDPYAAQSIDKTKIYSRNCGNEPVGCPCRFNS